MTRVSRTFTITVNAADPVGGPDWWQDAAFVSGSWKALCTTTPTKITNVYPSPLPQDSAQVGGSPPQVATAWNGAVVDQATRQLILCGNGGDFDYCGNEVYALDLGRNLANLKWERIGEPSVNSSITGTGALTQDYYLDGARKSDHTNWSQFFYSGKVWTVIVDSCWARKSSGGIWSWDRATAAAGARGGNWGAFTGGPWVRYGDVPNDGQYQFTTGAFDSTTNRYWRATASFMANVFYVDATAPTTSTLFTSVGTGTEAFSCAKHGSSVIAEDMRTWIVMANEVDTGTGRLCLIDISTTPPTKLGVVTTTMGTAWGNAAVGKYPQNGHLMYHNGDIYFGAPYRMGGVLKKLTVPFTGSGATKRANPAGVWTWTTLSNNGTAPAAMPWTGVTPTSSAGTYSKLNIVHDMGNGQAALVLLDHVDLPTYVYKLPVAAVPASYPNANNTGVPQGTVLTNSGNIVSTANNQIIENKNVTGNIEVSHSGVIVRKCRITAPHGANGVENTANAAKDLIVEDCEIVAVPHTSSTRGYNGVLLSYGGTVRRCNISEFENAIFVSINGPGPTLLEDNYLRVIPYQGTTNDPHIDVLQFWAGVSNCTIRHNWVEGQTDISASITFGDNNANILVENNVFIGGAYVFRMGEDASCGTNIRIINNKFSQYPEGVFRAQCGYYGLWSVGSNSGRSGNTYYESGLPVPDTA